ncbi:type I restriction enzyme HsdR N-terminal domain-containing protein [Rapidithrix thailandica]|uniref:Type I restriction enzyme HsdR N-terminal domain-containing protein n=1 Tax=Rapidithrix thailandica TaxID=413964 RepID=A0AAW9S395_9BACT
MLQLNLPTYDYKVQKRENKLFIQDIIRKKYVRLTPEEWVRQHFIHFLLSANYPKALISVESALTYNKLNKRSDILVYDSSGLPFFLVECKAPNVKLTRDTLQQALVYNSVQQASFVAITNGLQHFFFKVDYLNNKFEGIPQLPPYPRT